MTREAAALAEQLGVRIFTADIIYHLFDQFTAYLKTVKEEEQEAAKLTAVFPCRLKVLQLRLRCRPACSGPGGGGGLARLVACQPLGRQLGLAHCRRPDQHMPPRTAYRPACHRAADPAHLHLQPEGPHHPGCGGCGGHCQSGHTHLCSQPGEHAPGYAPGVPGPRGHRWQCISRCICAN